MSEYGKFENVSKNLIQAIADAGSQRKFAKKIGVNDYYVNQLVKHGIEPTDKTAQGREIRVKLFLPRRKNYKPLPEWVKPIRKRIAQMAKQTRVDLGLQK